LQDPGGLGDDAEFIYFTPRATALLAARDYPPMADGAILWVSMNETETPLGLGISHNDCHRSEFGVAVLNPKEL